MASRGARAHRDSRQSPDQSSLERRYAGGLSSQQCAEESLSRAAAELTEMYVSAIRRQAVASLLTIVFPEGTDAVSQHKFLYSLETRAVFAAKTKIEADAATLTPYDWSVEKRQLDNWSLAATLDAYTGDNWEQKDSHTDVFKDGGAYQQLKSVGLNGWASN